MVQSHTHGHELIGKGYAAIAKMRRSESPRLFMFTYDRTKIKSRNPQVREEYTHKLTRWGVEFPQGDFPYMVVVQGDDPYDSFDALRVYYDKIGKYEIMFVDEEAGP